MPFTKSVPLLRILDEAKAKDFHVGFLGFKVDWEHRFEPGMPLYMQVSRAGLVFHLSEHHGDGSPGANVFVWMKGLDDFHAEISSKGYGYMRPCIETAFYDARYVSVTDPFGNRIGFNETLSPRADGLG